MEIKYGQRVKFSKMRLGVKHTLFGTVERSYTDKKGRSVTIVVLDTQFNGINAMGVYTEKLNVINQ